MAISKKLRQQVYDKYGGLCAYTGKPLDEKWQVDHVTPLRHWVWLTPEQIANSNNIENLLPAIRKVNHYKRCLDLEGFRQYMLTFHTRLAKLPKKTRLRATEQRIAYMQEVAALFDITPDRPFNGKFYFETINVTQHGTL